MPVAAPYHDSGQLELAVLSPCGTYRYQLRRQLARGGRPAAGPPLVFLMLNPSTADAVTDDATIRRCRAFAGTVKACWLSTCLRCDPGARPRCGLILTRSGRTTTSTFAVQRSRAASG
jgi:hypothetical protein